MLAQKFQLDADAGVRRWLDSHPSTQARVIAYDVHRCCGGGKICQLKVRELSQKDDLDEFATSTLADGTRFLIDRKAAVRLPSQFRLTVRGVGRFKHLDLDLDGDQWGTPLYD